MLVDRLHNTHNFYANGPYFVESDFSRAMSGESILRWVPVLSIGGLGFHKEEDHWMLRLEC